MHTATEVHSSPRLSFYINGLIGIGTLHPMERRKTEYVLCPELVALTSPVIPRPLLTGKDRPDERNR